MLWFRDLGRREERGLVMFVERRLGGEKVVSHRKEEKR
jgi:hypothetical protein